MPDGIILNGRRPHGRIRVIHSGLTTKYLSTESDVKDAKHPKGKSLTSVQRQILFSQAGMNLIASVRTPFIQENAVRRCLLLGMATGIIIAPDKPGLNTIF